MSQQRPGMRNHWRSPLGLVLLLGGGVLLLRQADDLQVWQQAIAWGLLAFTAGLLFRPGFQALVGPVLTFDAVRTARRSRSALLRSAYALLLLVVLFLVYTRSFGQDLVAGLAGIMDEQTLPPRELANFAASFFHTFLVVQFVAVLLLAPAFTAGAIAEERETGTLPLLLTTDLYNREIVLGKLLARLGHLMLLLLTGVPILSLLQLLGGVDPALLVAGFAITFLTAIGVGSLGILCSSHCARPREAIFLTYVCIGGYQLFTGFFCGVFAFQAPDSVSEYALGTLASGNLLAMYFQLTRLSQEGALGSELPLLLLQYLGFHGFLSVVALGWAMAQVRAVRRSGSRSTEPATRPSEILKERRPLPHPKLDTWEPMLWKEYYFERGLELHPVAQQLLSMGTAIILSLVGTVFFCGVLGTVWLGHLPEFSNLFLQVCVPVVAMLGMLGLALRSAGAFTGERERQTLDSLLTTDLTDREILVAKLAGCLRGVRNIGMALAILLGVGIITGGLFPLLALLEVLALAAHGGFAVCLGLYCSLLSRTTLRATVATITILLVVMFGHWLVLLAVTTVCHLLGTPGAAEGLATFHAYGLTPPLTQLSCLVSFPEVVMRGHMEVSEPPQFKAAFAGTLVYGGMAACLWGLLRARFPAVTGRMK